MKENRIMFITSIIIAIILIGGMMIIRLKPSKDEDVSLKDSKYEKVYSFVDNKNIFVGVKDLNIHIDGKEYTIEKAYEKGLITIEKLKNKSTSNIQLNDGGSIFYYFNNSGLSDIDFTLCVCKNVNGNRNVYLIPDEGEFKSPCW